MRTEILDTTLRDGAQSAGIGFCEKDKLQIICALDALGVPFIEAGNFAIDDDMKIFASFESLKLENSNIVAFGSTCKAGSSPKDDPYLTRIIATPVKYVSIVGKAHLTQVKDILCTTPEENIRIIKETVEFLTANGKSVFFDAEHFFDGYNFDKEYALKVLDAAQNAGASRLILCDTNGGMLPRTIGKIVSEVAESFPRAKIGIHCHNDIGLAVACSLEAVLSGACHVQATVSGIGERCGNANLNTLIPLLQMELARDCIDPDNLKILTPTARYINEIANRQFDESEPFVGGSAFTHKAGMHIDAVSKTPRSFEHIDPLSIGNTRNFVVSSLAGRSAIYNIMKHMMPGLTKDDPIVASALTRIKTLESEGFRFENADASLYLRLLETAGLEHTFFSLKYFRIISSDSENERAYSNENASASALIRIAVGDSEEIFADEGEGPVNAIDRALRKALTYFYPEISNIKFCDFKMRVLGSNGDSSSKVIFHIATTDGKRVWQTAGVSTDVVNAAWQAIRDSLVYYLEKMHEGKM